MKHDTPADAFDRQVENLLHKQYPAIAHLTVDRFIQLVIPLKEKLLMCPFVETDMEKGSLSFVLVVTHELVDRKRAMSLVVREGKNGKDVMRPHEPSEFVTNGDVSVPRSPVYLLVAIDRGKETLNVTPKEARTMIDKANRSPLTIDEGIAIVTQYPDFLRKNNCFSLLASRIPGNKRVPAIWINAKKEPNLGWCWEGNPHTWLGSASARMRIGV